MSLLLLRLLPFVLVQLLIAPDALPVSARSVAASLPSQTPTLHLFLIAGQSNSVGYNTDGLTPEDAVNPRILQLVVCGPNNTVLAPDQCYLNVSSDPLIPCQGGKVSAWRSFARTLLPTLPEADRIVLVSTGLGGTGFRGGVWPAYTGSGFVTAIAKLRRAWELMGQGEWAKYDRSFDAFLWMHGTADAGDNQWHFYANTSWYLYHDLVPMIEAVRNVTYLPFSKPTLPFVAGQMLPEWMDNTTYPDRSGVKLANALLTQYVPYTGFVDTYGAQGDRGYPDPDGELIHFTAATQRILGKRYYAQLEAAKLNYAVGQHPGMAQRPKGTEAQ